MANIKDLLGEAYVEGMSNDDIVKALENVTLPQDNSDEVTRLKNAKDKATAEAAEYKRKLKDHMSEEEKRATEEAERIKAIETENEALRKQIALADLTKQFMSSGLDAEISATCAEAAYTGDMTTVIGAYTTKLASTKDEVRAQLISETPAMKGGKSTKVKDFSSDINSSLATGDFATAAALTRMAQNNNNND